MKRKNRLGFAPVEVIVVAAVVLLVGALIVKFSIDNGNSGKDQALTGTNRNQQSTALSPEPVSDSTDLSVIEKELEETDLGNFEGDIDAMEMEASEL